MRGLGLALLLAAGAAAQNPAHSMALVNDPRSHGQIGDNLLSLNEAILLNQRLLQQSQLSPAEQAQIQGFGTDVAWADIDMNVVPKVTLERDLDPINDIPHGLVIGGSNGTPTIDISGTKGFIVTANFADFRGLVIQGGTVGITLTQTNAVYGTVIESVTFLGQSSTGLRAYLTSDAGTSHLQIERSAFVNLPTAVEVFDSGKDRTGDMTVLDSQIQGGQTGLAVHLGPGGVLTMTLDRLGIQGTTTGVVFDRATTADTRLVLLSSLHLAVQGGVTGLSFQGHISVPDVLSFNMADLAGQSHALRLWPVGTSLSATIDDSRLTGGVQLFTGLGSGILVANARMKNGNLDLGSAGAPLRVTDSILDTMTTQTLGSAGAQIDASRFVLGSVQGTAAAPITVTGCHMGATAVGSQVSVTNALANAQLGSLEVIPLQPQLGATMTLQADLPGGLSGYWVLGLAETLPYLGPRPLHLYFFLTAHVVVPVPVQLQQQIVVPVPNNTYLLGFDFVAQMAVVPTGGIAAPPLSMPPGRRILFL